MLQHVPLLCFSAGREAYLRTKHALDEASAVSSMLFLDDGDMHGNEATSKRYQADERRDSFDAAVGAGAGGWMADTDKRNSASALFGQGSLFLSTNTGEADGVSGRVSEGMAGGILAAAAGRRAPLGVVDIRPEEKQFCDAFLELQNLMVSLPVVAFSYICTVAPKGCRFTNLCGYARRSACINLCFWFDLFRSKLALAVGLAVYHRISWRMQPVMA